MGPNHRIAPSGVRGPASDLRVECSTSMHADLERVIALQRLDTAASAARKTLAEAPEREKAFETRLAGAKKRAGDARTGLGPNQDAPRRHENVGAGPPGRL